MELRHLRYFLAVGEALNFTKAAAQLRVAQPALSRQVQDLEDEIGVNLDEDFVCAWCGTLHFHLRQDLWSAV